MTFHETTDPTDLTDLESMKFTLCLSILSEAKDRLQCRHSFRSKDQDQDQDQDQNASYFGRMEEDLSAHGARAFSPCKGLQEFSSKICLGRVCENITVQVRV